MRPEQLDAVLPQTQCGLCGYGGCMPYAKAMVSGEAGIQLCPPGGVPVMQALGRLLNQDPTPYIADMEAKTLPPRVAIIREADCIGCTKCIQACPVDAIIGAPKLMHTIITDACTGCELCIPPCPVDCIDLQESAPPTASEIHERRERFQAHNLRLKKHENDDSENNQQVNLSATPANLAAALERIAKKKKI